MREKVRQADETRDLTERLGGRLLSRDRLERGILSSSDEIKELQRSFVY